MKNRSWFALCLAALAACTCCAQQSGTSSAGSSPPAVPLSVTLPGFADGSRIPDKYTCLASPRVVSPEIQWSHVPAGTQSFVLLFHDLEPHPGKGLMDNSHWILWNIPGSSTGLAEDVPAGSTLTDGTHQMKRPRSTPGSPYSYYGPCAPAGPNHHYVLELYALDTMLTLPEDASRVDILKATDGHILAASSWIGYFHR